MAMPPTAYGDIFQVQTPALDRYSQQLYAEQKQREAKAATENQQADAAMQKQFANVRSADVPDVINSWNKYKTLKTQMLSDKTLQKDPLKYAQAQQAANEALADTYSTINGSKDLKDLHKGLISAHAAHPDSFDDNFGTLMSTAQNLPLKQLKASKLGDLTNADTYAYKGSNTDFQKMGNAAAGQPKAVYQAEAPVDASGLQTKVTPYLYPNSPAQYLQSYMGALAQHKAGKDAAIAWDAIPQDQKEYVDKAYNALTPDQWLKRTGSPTPQQLVPSNPDNKAENFAIFQAKLHAISNEPKEGAPVFRTNEAKKFQMETNRQQVMERIRHADAKDLINYREAAKAAGPESNDLWVDKMIDHYDELADSGPTGRSVRSGKTVYEKDIPIDPILSKSLQKGGVSPISVRKTSDGKYFVSYPQLNDKGQPEKDPNSNVWAVDNSLSGPISREQLALSMGAKNTTGKARSKEINSALGGSKKADHSQLSTDPKDWKKVGDHYQYKDGSMYDASGNKIK
jgi:hypothetical protein